MQKSKPSLLLMYDCLLHSNRLFRSGAFESSEQTNSQAVKKQRANRDVVEKAQLPQHLTNYKNDSKEATPAEIERVYNQIRRMCLQDCE